MCGARFDMTFVRRDLNLFGQRFATWHRDSIWDLSITVSNRCWFSQLYSNCLYANTKRSTRIYFEHLCHFNHDFGATENAGRENDGPSNSKSQGVKTRDTKMQNKWRETIASLLWSYRVLVRNDVIWCSALCWFCTLGPDVFLLYTVFRKTWYNFFHIFLAVFFHIFYETFKQWRKLLQPVFLHEADT